MKEVWQQESFLDEPQPVKEQRSRQVPPEKKLRKAIEPYIDVETLRRLANDHHQLTEALRTGDVPEEISWLLSLFAAMIAPIERYQIRSPADVAAHLMLRMGHLCQEQFCVVCLNTKNRVQKIHTVYQGNVNASVIRIAEVYREPIKLNSSGVIFAHNHPSSDPTPSPEDVLLTGQLVEAGKLLDIDPLDHLVIARDTWVSLRERGLGFQHP